MVIHSESEDEASVQIHIPQSHPKEGLSDIYSVLHTLFSKLSQRHNKELVKVPNELLPGEIRNLTNSISKEIEILVNRDSSNSRKIASLEDRLQNVIIELNEANMQLDYHKSYEKNLVEKIDSLESRVQVQVEDAREEIPSNEVVEYFEQSLNRESTEKIAYKSVVERLKSSFKGELPGLLDGLVDVLVQLENVRADTVSLQNTCKAPLDQDPIEEWQSMVDEVTKGLKIASRKEQELLDTQSNIEARIDELLDETKRDAGIARKILGNGMRQRNEGGLSSGQEYGVLARPRSSYQLKSDRTKHNQHQDQQQRELGTSEWLQESKKTFSSVKSRLEEMKNNLS